MRIETDILAAAQRSPNHPALECGSRTVTFGELDGASKRLASALGDVGIPIGAPVWILMENDPAFVFSALAILRYGAVVVPVHAGLSNRELAQVAAACPPAALMTLPGRRLSLGSGLDVDTDLGSVVTDLPANTDVDLVCLRNGRAVDRRIRTDHGQPGVVYMTSGSTGQPKAVLLTHENIASSAQAAATAFALGPADRTVVCMPMCHSFTFTKQLLAHLGRGATAVLTPGFFEPAVVLDTIADCDCTTLFAVPTMYVMLLERMRRAAVNLSSLRMMVTGGAPMPEATLLELINRLPNVEFISSYGLSEASPFVSWLPARWSVEKIGSVGQAAPGVAVSVLGKDAVPVPRGVVGEVCVRGPNVMARYLNNSDATASTLHDGCLHTGDLGRLDADGCLYLCGRRDDLILRGGENIYPLEIESVLCGHSTILDASVVGVSHPVLGQDLMAFVVPRAGQVVAVEDLRAHCRRDLAAFKVPRRIEVVPTLPRTANGKINRRQLREQARRSGDALVFPEHAEDAK